MILGLTSNKYDKEKMYDEASTVMEQKLSQIPGVGQVVVGGASLPAVRVDVNPTQLNSYGLTLDNVRSVLSLQNSDLAKGQLSDGAVTADILDNDQISKAAPIQAADRRLPQWSGGPFVRRCHGDGRRAGHPQCRISERNSFGHGHHLPPARRQYH